ncbi:MAG: 16S rRNA (guanine(527)-N(7))-methyltransferase RsmG [Cyclobacteriaceae bacterium]|nr:16S rRNA (guanine(527)-N(7))-methyltransferase RsmG [Cyclobacteriaceae bacterium]
MNDQQPTANIVFTYFPGLTSKQKAQFEQLMPLYAEWNEKINVISRKDIANLYVHHVLHSLGIAKVVTFKKGAAVLDVGTGGGFPGIPLAILFPDVRFHLVDSIGKKITVVKAVAKALGLENVTAQHIRAEELKGSYDFAVTRAVAPLATVYRWVNRRIKTDAQHTLSNGLLFLKGGDLTEEINDLKRPCTIFNLYEYFPLPFFETKKVVFVGV